MPEKSDNLGRAAGKDSLNRVTSSEGQLAKFGAQAWRGASFRFRTNAPSQQAMSGRLFGHASGQLHTQARLRQLPIAQPFAPEIVF